MNILDTIVAQKKIEISERRIHTPLAALEARQNFLLPVSSLAASLTTENSTGIIAEFKRKSPSKGFIKQDADIRQITAEYTKSGAAGLSVLTDETFFGGSDQDLLSARMNNIPILRKEFIIDEYQIVEAKSLGADVILLIAACLTPTEVRQFAQTANSLGLESILELHAEEELGHVCDEVTHVGINNRDLKTFNVDIERSLCMAEKIPDTKIKIAESGIDKVETIHLFRQNGFKGFLIGEYFMKQRDTGLAFKAFVDELKLKAQI